MNKVSLSILLAFAYINAATISLNQGWNLIGIDGDVNASDFSNFSSITQATSGGVTAGDGLTYIKGTYSDGKTLLGQGYWVLVGSGSETITYTTKTVDFVYFKSGWNLVNLPDGFAASSFSQYSNITQATSGGVSAGAGLTYIKGSYSDGQAIAGQGYWVLSNGSVLMGSKSNLSTILPSMTTENLNNKSLILVDENASAKIYSFDSNQTYRMASLSSLNLNYLNGSDSEINASVVSALPSSVTCGYNWNVSATNTVNITEVSGGTKSATYTPSDGNFTIGSTYNKVVWFSNKVDLSSKTCSGTTSTGVDLPPSVPSS